MIGQPNDDFSDDDDDVMEAQLATLLEEHQPDTQKTPEKNLVEQSALDTQVTKVLKNVDADKEDIPLPVSKHAEEYDSFIMESYAVVEPCNNGEEVVIRNGSPSSIVESGGVGKPKTVLEALEQRLAKYQSSASDAAKEGNDGKARRMGRIVNQYKSAINSHKAGKGVNFDELPVPPGYPPIPCNEITTSAITINEVFTEESETLEAAEGGSSENATFVDESVSEFEYQEPTTATYDQLIALLTDRQSAFKQAALAAKQSGDKKSAVDYFLKMKSCNELIDKAKNGFKVDIKDVPQLPAEDALEETTDQSEHFSDHAVHNLVEEDDEASYSRLLDTLLQQVKKAQAYAQQMIHSSDVAGAEKCDRLAENSQADYDYVCSCRQLGEAPPRFHYKTEVVEVMQINPDIGTEELELHIVQCIDLRCAKDSKVHVEWEMPYPHDKPIKGRTAEGKGSQHCRFEKAVIRVPFQRKQKSILRAVKSKSIKLDVKQKGGLLGGDKSIGVAMIRLNTLENQNELHEVEELKERRNPVGKIEVYVKLRTPLLSSVPRTVSERWLLVE